MLVIMIVSPLTFAVGITYSRVIEWLAVCLYFISLYAYGYFVLNTPFRNRVAKGFVAVSALILLRDDYFFTHLCLRSIAKFIHYFH